MSEPTPIEKFSVPTFLGFYVFLVSFAHEFGYWRNFHINFLEYVGLADLPKLAVVPIAATAGASIISALFALVAFPIPAPGSGANTPTGILVNRLRTLIRFVGILMIILGVWLFFVTRFGENWYAIGPVLISFGFVIAVDLGRVLAQIGIKLPNYSDFLFCLLPLMAFGVGHSDATSIINGHHFVEASFTNSGSTLRYLERAGDYVFFYDSSNLDTVIYKLESIQPLTLQYRESDATADGAATSKRGHSNYK